MAEERVNEYVLRAVRTERFQAVYWRNGGLDVNIDGDWQCRWNDGTYVREVHPERIEMLEGILKEDVRLREQF